MLWLAIGAYTLASLLHFVHNAEMVHEYPNLPAVITRGSVYGAWLGIAAIGAIGVALWRTRFPSTGLVVLMVYAALGFSGLAHYAAAPYSAHSIAMNATIMFESTAACVLLVVLARRIRAVQ